MKKILLLLLLGLLLLLLGLFFVPKYAYTENISCTSFSLTHSKFSYPHFVIEYITVNSYIGLKVWERVNGSESYGYLFLSPTNYDKFNGDSFYFPPDTNQFKLDIYCSDEK